MNHPSWNRSAIARSFRVARSTLYVKPRQPEKDKQLLTEVLSVLEEHPHYGHRRIALTLQRNHKPILRIMKKYGIKTKKKRRKYLRKRKDEKNLPTGIPNRIKQLCPILPDAVWVGDFTYLIFYGTYIYLATVIDLYTREVIGISIGLHHSAELVIAALEDAKQKRKQLPQIFHSDQGSEYASRQCRLWLLAHKILPSHSYKAHPWENGHQESFFGRFKEELENIHRFNSLEELMAGIYHQIHYYNTKRIHSKLKMTPQNFYQKVMAR